LTTEKETDRLAPIMNTRLDLKYLHGMKIIRLKSEIDQFLTEMGKDENNGCCYLFRARKVRRKVNQETNEVLCRGHWVIWLYKVPSEIVICYKQLNTSFEIILK
jgi:hypothetical protein